MSQVKKGINTTHLFTVEAFNRWVSRLVGKQKPNHSKNTFWISGAKAHMVSFKKLNIPTTAKFALVIADFPPKFDSARRET